MKRWAGLVLLVSMSCRGLAEPVCARSAAVLRKSPGANQPVSWKVGKWMPFLRLERKSGWSKVQDLDGELHWARAMDLTTKGRCVVVKAQVAKVHREPNPNSQSPHFKTLDRYTPLERLDANRDWLQVRDESGHVSWIRESDVWKPVSINTISF